MLDDAHKPLRGTTNRKALKPANSTANIDLRVKGSPKKIGAERLANARDKTSLYSLSQDSTMSEKEKAEMRKQLKERFQPGARALPATIQGLEGIASQRIDDAIARGQFRNIPRGKGVNIERDPTASSPFLDTTEYFMNKIIKKQEILPPWVEKQNELTRAATTFRSRLRADWKRHAARVIASKGGSVESQVQRAEAYAAAEATTNPKTPKSELISTISSQGAITHIEVQEMPVPQKDNSDSKITVTETISTSEGISKKSEVLVKTSKPQPTFSSSESSSPLPAASPSATSIGRKQSFRITRLLSKISIALLDPTT